MEKRFDYLFMKVLFLLKFSLLYMTLLLVGGIVLGIAPAVSSLTSMYHTYGTTFESYRLAEAMTYFKKQFWVSNGFLAGCLGLSLLLLYGIYLTTQVPQTFVTVLVTVVNLFLILYLYCVFMSYVKLQVYYDCPFRAMVKLAAIAVFFDWLAIVKLLFGTVILLVLMFKVSLVLGLLLPAIWLVFAYDVLEPIHIQVEKSLV